MHRLPSAALFALLTACSGESSTVNAAGDIILRDFACAECRIVVDSVAYLGHEEDTVAIGQNHLPVRDSRGRYYLVENTMQTVLVFGPNGRLLQRFGKAGRGPGEFDYLEGIYPTRGDTLLVNGGGVMHVMSPEYSHVRQFPNTVRGGGFLGTVLSDNRVLLGSGNHQFTLVDLSGVTSEPVKLGGLDSATANCGGCSRMTYRERLGGGGVWSGPTNTYTVESHDLSGNLVKRFIRTVDWFVPRPAQSTSGEIQAHDADPVVDLARPRLIGARQDSSGVVWTHVMKIDNPQSVARGDDLETPKGMARIMSAMVTRVESIDSEHGVLLAGTMLPGIVIPLERDLSAQLIVDPSGDWAWKILRFRIERR